MGTIECPGLSAAVVVRRDERGIPFIEATNEADLYFAQGYATASDRLWQMDFLRRTARGELAEVLGAAAIEVDKLHRVYGFRSVAEKLFARASDHARRCHRFVCTRCQHFHSSMRREVAAAGVSNTAISTGAMDGS